MKGLLIKDFFVISKQLKIFIAALIIFSIMPGYSLSVFAILYSGLLPITALAYDERSKWNNLAAMMPYSMGEIVFSKYLLGYICVFGISILSVLGGLIYSLISNTPYGSEQITQLIFSISLTLIIQALNMPLIFRMGVEKGRMLFVFLIAIIVAAFTILSERFTVLFTSGNQAVRYITVLLPVAAVLLSILSVPLSTYLYKKRT